MHLDNGWLITIGIQFNLVNVTFNFNPGSSDIVVGAASKREVCLVEDVGGRAGGQPSGVCGSVGLGAGKTVCVSLLEGGALVPSVFLCVNGVFSR